jgi:hypothetical protein
LDYFFEVASDLRDPTSRFACAANSFKIQHQESPQTSGIAEEHDFDRFEAQLCSRLLTTDSVKDARDQLVELKQIKSAKSYSFIFRTVALSVTDLSPDESLDRYLRGLKKYVRAQVLLQKPANSEDAMRLAKIYDTSVFGFSEKKHYKKPGAEFPPTAHTLGDAMEVETLTQKKIPKLTSELKVQLKTDGRCYFCRSYHKDLPQECCSFCEAKK